MKHYSIDEEFRKSLSLFPDGPAKNYIVDRLIRQIVWYDTKALGAQRRFQRWSMVSFFCSLMLPVLTILSTHSSCIVLYQILVAVIGAIITISSTLSARNRYLDLWTNYRSNCEILKSILHRYLTGTSEFYKKSEDEALDLLVSECEEYLVREFETWTKGNSPVSDEDCQSSSTKS